jgi:hypothetical protein
LPSVEAAQDQVIVPGVVLAVTAGLGVDGAPVGVTGDDQAEYEPVPTALVAATRNSYDVPSVSPVTVYGVSLAEEVAMEATEYGEGEYSTT